MNSKQTNYNISWQRVLIFFIIAILCSNIFRFNLLGHKEALSFLPALILVPVLALLEGSGVYIGAIVSIPLLKRVRRTEISFWGRSKKRSFMMAIIPIIVLTILGVNNDFLVNAHFYGFIASGTTIIYCIMEEYGWRGYLQEEFRETNPFIKYCIIGFLWYVWHLSFLSDTGIINNLFFLAMMILSSWGIGQIAAYTKSILASACFHMIINIMMFNDLIRDGINSTEKLVVLVISVFLWIVIMKKWN